MAEPVHPGPAAVALPAGIRAAIVEHALADDPNEACGLVIGDRPAGDGGVARRYEPTRNKAASPYRYEIDPDDLYRLTIAADDADETFWAIVHSHTHTPAVPSPTDVGLAFYPDALYVLVSLAPDQADPVAGGPGDPCLAHRRRHRPRGGRRDRRGARRLVTDRSRRDAIAALLAGVAAIVGATLIGSIPGLAEAVITPPPLVRAALVAATVVLGLWLLTRSVSRMSAAGTEDVPGLIRAVRLAFLAVAAFAAAAGWALGHPLPLLVAAVIAGIDVVETSLLLLVVGAAS